MMFQRVAQEVVIRGRNKTRDKYRNEPEYRPLECEDERAWDERNDYNNSYWKVSSL